MGIFNRDNDNHNTEAVGTDPNKPPEKTQAELIAEAVTGAFNAVVKPALDTIGTRVDGLEKKVTPPVRTESAPPETPTFTSVFEDEDAAINQRVIAAVGPVWQAQLLTGARIALAEVKAEYEAKGYGTIWASYADKINERLNKEPLVDTNGQPVRGNPARIKEIVSMIFGEAAMANGLRFGGTDKGFFIESAGGAADGSGAGPVADGLTQEQRSFASRNKINVEDYKKSVARLKFVH